MSDTNPVVKIVLPTFTQQVKAQSAALGATLVVFGGIGAGILAAGYVIDKIAKRRDPVLDDFETRHPE